MTKQEELPDLLKQLTEDEKISLLAFLRKLAGESEAQK